MKLVKGIRRKLYKGDKMIVHTRTKYFILLIISLVLLIHSPAVSKDNTDEDLNAQALLVDEQLSLSDDVMRKTFKENSEAVVVVTAYDEKGNTINQGSGFVVREDGAVVTNYHVISKAKDIKVKAGNKVFDVEGLLFTDKENDLVILKARAKNMPVVTLGDIEATDFFQIVCIISSYEGYKNTISKELLMDSEIIFGNRLFVINASQSIVNSGDPVFNRNGEVIGVAAVFKEAQYTKFVIPVNLIKDKIHSKKVTAIKKAVLEEFENTAGYWMVFYSLGSHYASLDMYKKAMEAYKQVMRIKPDYAKANFSLGSSPPPSGKHNEAIEAYKQMIMINPDDALYYYYLGKAYSGLDMHNKAIDAYKQAIQIDPNNAWSYSGIGNAYGLSGMYKEAIDTYRQAIRINPNLAITGTNYGMLGTCYRASGMYKEAIDAYKHAIKIDSDSVYAHHGLGSAYVNLGMYQEAIDAFKQAIKINPGLAEAHVSLGLAYNRLSMYQEAIEAYKQAIIINPDSWKTHAHLGATYSFLGKQKEAIESYKQSIRILPNIAMLHFGLGTAFKYSDMHKEAIDAFKQVIRIKPDYPRAHLELGIAYYSLAEVYMSQPMQSSAASVNTGNVYSSKDSRVYHHDRNCSNLRSTDNLMRFASPQDAKNAGGIRCNYCDSSSVKTRQSGSGMYKNAIDAFKQAIRINPDLADAHLHLGTSYGQLGKEKEGNELLKQAARLYKQAIRINPDNADAHFSLGILHLFLHKDKGSALEEYKILKNLDTEKANKLFNEIYE